MRCVFKVKVTHKRLRVGVLKYVFSFVECFPSTDGVDLSHVFVCRHMFCHHWTEFCSYPGWATFTGWWDMYVQICAEPG